MPAGRVVALDGLRAAAFLAVLAYHLGWGADNAGVGVTVFFTLSGFLITTLLLRELTRDGRVRIPRFYIRRALRVMPALIVFVVACAVYVTIVAHGTLRHDTLTGAVPTLLYVGNWLRAAGTNIGLLNHTWSLSVEQQFYLVWPPVLVGLHALGGRRAVLAGAAAGAIAALALRLWLWDGPASQNRVFTGSDTSADKLLIGAVLACVIIEAPAAIRRIGRLLAWPALAALVAVTVVHVDARALFTWGPALISVATAIVVCELVSRPGARLGRALAAPPLVAIGRVSYGLYLWHFPAIIIIGGQVHAPVVESILVVLTTAVAAVLSFRYVEQPVLRRRTRVVPPAAGEAVTDLDHAPVVTVG